MLKENENNCQDLSNNEIEKLLDKNLKICMDGFDFKKVHKCMTMLKWKWILNRNGNSIMDIPTIEEMKRVVKFNLYEMLKSDVLNQNLLEHNGVATGGFQLIMVENYDLELEFVLVRKRTYLRSYK